MNDVNLDRSQVLSDLRWVVTSPALLDEHSPRFRFSSAAQRALDKVDSGHLLDFVEVDLKTSRVGAYFESLVCYALKFLEGFEVVMRNHQLFDGGRTIGEIDFLLRTASGTLIHLEVALKFYLYHASGQSSVLIGPNPRDHYEQKVSHMLERQLEISRRLTISVDSRKLLLIGRIHYPIPKLTTPISREREPAILPHGQPLLSKEHLQGLWVRASQALADWHSLAELPCAIPSKPLLLSSPSEESCPSEPWAICRNKIAKHFSMSHESLPLRILAHSSDLSRLGNEPPTTWLQALHGKLIFLVSDNWPNWS